MLRHLTIRSFALVDEVDLDLHSGLTVLIGETGAGKSIIIDALSVALGERVSSDVVRTGKKKAIVEAVFSPDIAGLNEVLAAHDLDVNDDGLVVRREITASGTTRCFVNDTPTTAAVVRELAAVLMDFHGQHDTHGLLNVARHREILDRSAGTSQILDDMRTAWASVVACDQEVADLQRRARSADEDRARLTFVLQEIVSIAPLPGEDEQITADLRRAEASESVLAAATSARDLLYSGETSAYDQIQQARDRVRDLLPFDASLQATLDELESALSICKEAAGSVAPLADEEDFSPERLEELRLRQVSLQRLVRKYGNLDEAISTMDRVQQELALLENLDDAVNAATEAAKNARGQAVKIAKTLTTQRMKGAKPLSSSITTALSTMGMPSSVVEIKIEPSDLGPNGADHIEFLFSANAGEDARPLAKIASGGELSRFMLALKKVLSESGSIGTLVFDEIDTGISGRIARHVGDVMKEIAHDHQVICITHLPQIASLADQMIRVTKTEGSNTSTVAASAISGEDVVVEIAKLLSGATVSEAALDGARELMTVPNKKRTR